MRPRTLLVGTDFSEHADQALSLALDLAARFDASLDLVHALDTPVPFFEPYAVSIPSDWMSGARSAAEDKLAERLETAREYGVEVAIHLVEGPAAIALSRHAKAIGADWIVVGTHGHGVLRHALLGSVAERTVREAPCAVLTVKNPRPFRRILVGADLSHHSDRALAVGAELAIEFAAVLELVHALHAPVPFVTPYEVVLPDSVVDSAFDSAERELKRLAEELPGEFELRTAVLAEPPHAALCDAAKRDEADLIVVGSHGHSGLKQMVLGSVAERVLRHAPCSVLTVREPR